MTLQFYCVGGNEKFIQDSGSAEQYFDGYIFQKPADDDNTADVDINTLNSPVTPVPLAELFRRPGVIGDSLAQGFYAATVQKKSQDWAYPVIVAKAAGAKVTYNALSGPGVNMEDVFKGWCDPICVALGIIGGQVERVELPTHVGITGSQYVKAVRTSGRCKNVYSEKKVRQKRKKRRWYWLWWYKIVYRWLTLPDCSFPDFYHRFGLDNAGTQIQIMEKIQPSFIFASDAANHVLCTALKTRTSCLNEEEFKRYFGEVMFRFRNIFTVRGGVLFTIPNVNRISYLEPYTDPLGRAELSGLKTFYRTFVTNPEQVLDTSEQAQITEFTEMLNDQIKLEAAVANYAVADIAAVFDDIHFNGREVRSPSGAYLATARTNWPVSDPYYEAGIFGLDGVHPNRYGHTVLATELIKAINIKYAVNIPLPSEYFAWTFDTLNQEPINIKQFLDHTLIGQMTSILISIYR